MTSGRIATVVLLSGALLLISPGFAGAQEATGASLTVRTVPALEGVRFMLDDTEFRSDENGVARIGVPVAGTYDLRVDSPVLVGDGRRAELIQWSDGITGRSRQVSIAVASELSAGFDISYIVREEWRDANGKDVSADLLDSFTITDDGGESHTHSARTHGLRGPTALVWQRHPPGTRWLVGSRVEMSSAGMISREVAYRIDHVSVGGNRIDASAATFYPARAAIWPVDLSAYELKLGTRGLIFGAPPAARLSVADSDGRTRRLPAPGAQTLLLPPGRYVARADASGVPLDSNVTLPGPARVDVTVVGVADLVAFVLVLGLVGGAVALWRLRPLRVRGFGAAGAIPQSAAGEKPSARPTRDLVRVYLDTGRTIEGWTEVGGDFGGVMILDVTRVLDGAGEEVAPSPSDSFVVTARVANVERLRASSPPMRDAGGNPVGVRSPSDDPRLRSIRARGSAS